MAERFDALLEPGSRGGMLVEIPFDVEAAFGAKRPPVVATVNGHAFRTTIAVYGGRSYVGIAEAKREETKQRRLEKAVRMLEDGVTHP